MQRIVKRRLVLVIGVLWTLLTRAAGQHVTGRPFNCRMKCVILDEDDGLLTSMVTKSWEGLRSLKKVNGLDLQIVRARAVSNFTIDGLLPTYMYIGSFDGSCMIGPYTRTHVMIGTKVEILYFMTTEPHENFLHWQNAAPVFPKTRIFYSVVKELVHGCNWTTIAILYDTAEALLLIEDLVSLPSVVVRAWKVPSNATWKALKAVLKDAGRSAGTVVLLHKSQSFLIHALDQALYLGMVSSQYRWVAPFLDIDKFDANKIADTGVTLYVFGLHARKSASGESATDPEHAIVHDTLLIMYQCIRQFHRLTGDCNFTNFTSRGITLHSLLSQIDGIGMTGRLTFDENGARNESEISILSLQPEGFKEIGIWNSSIKDPERRLRLHQETSSKVDVPFKHELLRIVSILEPPFLMNKASRSPGSNVKYEGFCIDLLEELSVHLDITYDIYVVNDQQYGRKLPDGSWTGMIRQIIDRKAAMAIAPMAITQARAEVVNFSDPICSVDIEAIGRSTSTTRSSKFRFTDPLAPQVWASLFVIMSAVSVLLYLFDRLVSHGSPSVVEGGVQPSEWRKEPGGRCGVWFTLAAILLGVTGGAAAPRSNAARLLVSVLWIFAVVVVSLYTAKMAAIMATSELQTATNQRLEDLLGHRDVSYGTARHGDVEWLLKTSSNPRHVRMRTIMAERDLPGSVDMFQQSLSDVTDNQDDGFQRVRRAGNRNYYFVWHSPGVRYHAAEDCDLETMETELGRLSYGIALPLGSPRLESLNLVLKTLREHGTLQKLENKWWGGKGCSTSFHRPDGVSLEDLTGLLIVLAVTIVVSTVISVLEHNFCRQKIEKKRNRRIPVKHSAVISTCDGVTGSNTVQMEEPFLPLNAGVGPGSVRSRQTQIF